MVRQARRRSRGTARDFQAMERDIMRTLLASLVCACVAFATIGCESKPAEPVKPATPPATEKPATDKAAEPAKPAEPTK